jgi:hypothetical protein
MTVRQFEGPVFDQTAIAAMRRALARSCAVIECGVGKRKTDSEVREFLACAILKSAESGEMDPLRLSAAALRQLPPIKAVHNVQRIHQAKRLSQRVNSKGIANQAV